MFEKLHSGEIYYPTDDSIMEVQLKCLDKLYDFNATRPSEMDKRMAIMKELFGDNTVIGAGSVVTKDIPSGVVAVGNPCKVLREISEHDYEFYYKDKKIPEEMVCLMQ